MRNFGKIFLFVLVFTVISFVPVAHAQLTFGGFNSVIIPCTVTPGVYLIYIIPSGASPPNLLFTPATIPFPLFAFLVPGAPVLGLAAAATAPCNIWVGPYIVTVGVGFPIIQEGTGLP